LAAAAGPLTCLGGDTFMHREDFFRIASLFEELDELEMALKEIRQAPDFRLVYTTKSNRPIERVVRPQVTALLMPGLENILIGEIARIKTALKNYGVEFSEVVAA
jgi:hypothetical protein